MYIYFCTFNGDSVSKINVLSSLGFQLSDYRADEIEIISFAIEKIKLLHYFFILQLPLTNTTAKIKI